MNIKQPSINFGNVMFDNKEDIQIQLDKNVPLDVIKQKEDKENDQILQYMSWWTVVEMANNIFGDDGWSNYISSCDIDSIEYENGLFEVTSSAQVKIVLKDGTSHEDVGVSTVYDKERGVAYEKSKKIAVVDGLKRAFRLFGNNLGNGLERKLLKTNNKENITKKLPVDLNKKKVIATKPKLNQSQPIIVIKNKK